MSGRPSAFEKRVKRRVNGPEHIFYAVCQPGLEPVCRAELAANNIPEKNIKTTRGGIEFTTRLARAIELNLTLASPSRILMRITRFKADSFSRLEANLSGIDWELYLPKNVPVTAKVSTKKSRLYHSDAVAGRCETLAADYLEKHGVFETPPDRQTAQTVYLRAENDVFTVSLDLSGDLMYRRGIKRHVTPAPLRENIAFAMLFLSGFSSGDMLLDPMCGSGTFSLEAALIKSGLPPGFFRSFAFEAWPAFSSNAFSHLKKQADKTSRHIEQKEIFASDIDRDAVDALLKNLAGCDRRLGEIIQVEETDFFSISPPKTGETGNGVIIFNPPYGKRLGIENSAPELYFEIGKKLNADFQGWRSGIIVPDKTCAAALSVPLDFRQIFHGGMNVLVGTGLISG